VWILFIEVIFFAFAFLQDVFESCIISYYVSYWSQIYVSYNIYGSIGESDLQLQENPIFDPRWSIDKSERW